MRYFDEGWRSFYNRQKSRKRCQNRRKHPPLKERALEDIQKKTTTETNAINGRDDNTKLKLKFPK